MGRNGAGGSGWVQVARSGARREHASEEAGPLTGAEGGAFWGVRRVRANPDQTSPPGPAPPLRRHGGQGCRCAPRVVVVTVSRSSASAPGLALRSGGRHPLPCRPERLTTRRGLAPQCERDGAEPIPRTTHTGPLWTAWGRRPTGRGRSPLGRGDDRPGTCGHGPDSRRSSIALPNRMGDRRPEGPGGFEAVMKENGCGTCGVVAGPSRT
jgi:hypothetical protein